MASGDDAWVELIELLGRVASTMDDIDPDLCDVTAQAAAQAAIVRAVDKLTASNPDTAAELLFALSWVGLRLGKKMPRT
jgi:hypothetical protein